MYRSLLPVPFPLVLFNTNPSNRPGFPLGQVDKRVVGHYRAFNPWAGVAIEGPWRGLSFDFIPGSFIVKDGGSGSFRIENDRRVSVAKSGGMCPVRVHDNRCITIVKSSRMRSVRVYNDRRVAVVKSS